MSLSSNTSSLGKHWKKVDTTKNSSSSVLTNTFSKPLNQSTVSSYSNTVVPSLHSIGKNSESHFSSSESTRNEATVSVNSLQNSLHGKSQTREETQCIILQTQALEELNTATEKIRKKEEVEELVGCIESSHEETINTLNMISENEEYALRIRQILSLNGPNHGVLPTSDREDHRVEDVFRSLVKMVHSLPLNNNERVDFDYAIQKVMDSKLSGKVKCEMITRHLLTTMGLWENGNISTAFSSGFDSEDWKSAGSICSRSGGLSSSENVFESSSFALTDSVSNDSNLSDLEGELRNASIRRAIEGPKQVFECSPWNTASIYSGFSSISDSRDSVQSVREPMSLSSYVMTSSVGESTLSSLSTTSMPNQIFENPNENVNYEQLATAFSASDPISSRPPRTVNPQSILQSSTGTRTRTESTGSLNYTNVSLGGMVDEALHTAKDIAETQAVNLLEALQYSARKCGVAVSDLMTAVSSSSESLSDTQASNHSNYSLSH
ncbi:hypothetical protein CAEBREN_28492 [Caenorhabditis brenneri]|uniref:Uncharacterized protein n=1 Tax=Caenorhabditis brenneri TaxID=135651 RepID=G0MK64_CAEBE|nr:hypothetical protein CAEBREN_28492 [Caenorhabditis brenneri]